MHIPDGYLSPGSAGVLYGVMAPFWYAAARKARRILSARTVPLMALLSAFCFVIMMLNIPLPGGTTGHAVGASLAAIILGPWPAVLAISLVLVIQAIFFADGGITALGANCLNMGVIMVFTSHLLYRVLSSKAKTPRAHGIAAAVAAYVALNLAALVAGVELGLQPWLAHEPDGTPLYAPYPIGFAVPAMLAGHLIVGFAEAALTGVSVAAVRRSAPELLLSETGGEESASLPVFWKRLRVVCAILAGFVILTPLGLLAPGTAWGEWGVQQLQGMHLGFVPKGLSRWNGFWSTLFAGYSIPGLGESFGYIVSALLGIALVMVVFWVITAIGRRTNKPVSG